MPYPYPTGHHYIGCKEYHSKLKVSVECFLLVSLAVHTTSFLALTISSILNIYSGFGFSLDPVSPPILDHLASMSERGSLRGRMDLGCRKRGIPFEILFINYILD